MNLENFVIEPAAARASFTANLAENNQPERVLPEAPLRAPATDSADAALLDSYSRAVTAAVERVSSDEWVSLAW